MKLHAVVQPATSELTAAALLTCTSSASPHRCSTELIQPVQPAEPYSLFFAGGGGRRVFC